MITEEHQELRAVLEDYCESKGISLKDCVEDVNFNMNFKDLPAQYIGSYLDKKIAAINGGEVLTIDILKDEAKLEKIYNLLNGTRRKNNCNNRFSYELSGFLRQYNCDLNFDNIEVQIQFYFMFNDKFKSDKENFYIAIEIRRACGYNDNDYYNCNKEFVTYFSNSQKRSDYASKLRATLSPSHNFKFDILK